MNIKTVGLITYDHPHLKTEQVLQRLLTQNYALKIYALPFMPRKPRKTLFDHRPDQSVSVAPRVMAERHGIPYAVCGDDTCIDASCDVYLILAGHILSPACVEGKRIINSHPGIIPSSRGLDSFKWAVYEMKPLGNTLHYIDAEVDAGEIISVVPTHVYAGDTLVSLARRHYESEIDCQVRFQEYLEHPENPFTSAQEGEARRRMPLSIERELTRHFPEYLEAYGA